MRTRGTLAVAMVLVVAVALVAVPVLGSVGDTAPASDGVSAIQANETDDGVTSNASLGAMISSFMQSSSAETESSVDSGMWAAAYNQSHGQERVAVVKSRIDRLERRSERLQERMRRLQSTYRNGTIPLVAYRAQASRLTAELEGLDEAIEATSDRASEVGVNTSQLDTLRNETREMSGRDIAAVARSIAVGPPDDAGQPGTRGPPEDVGRADDAGPSDAAGPQRPGSLGDVGPSENVTRDDRSGLPTDAGGPDGSGDRGVAEDSAETENADELADQDDLSGADELTDTAEFDDNQTDAPLGGDGGGLGGLPLSR